MAICDTWSSGGVGLACNLRILEVEKVLKGCLWIDLDERVVEPQLTREAPQAVTAGGSQTIWACRRLLHRVTFSIENDHF